MPIPYSVLKGTVVGSMRAEVVEAQVRAHPDLSNNYEANHFNILVDAAGTTWRCPVNVRSKDNSEVWFTVVDSLRGYPILDDIADLAEGLHELPQRRAGLTLDYVREPLFDRTVMRHLPLNVAGANNDVQDHLELLTKQVQAEAGAFAYIFGSFWRNEQFPPDVVLNTNSGVHNIHMNQGNSRNFQRDDGIYQDGGVIYYFPQTDRFVGIFLAFNTQVWFTNNENGHRLPGYAEGPLVGSRVQPVPPPAAPDPAQPLPVPNTVRIVAALVNPEGDDVGKETVTLFNTSPAISLAGWSLVDRQNNVEQLPDMQVPFNQSVTITLSGRGAQLGNRGGSLRLIDDQHRLVDSVTYIKAQAISGRSIVF